MHPGDVVRIRNDVPSFGGHLGIYRGEGPVKEIELRFFVEFNLRGVLDLPVRFTKDEIEVIQTKGSIMNEFEARQYVQAFVGDDLMLEVDRRTGDGQRPGEAVCNAGDHADKLWSWANGWSDLMLADTWVKTATWLQNWGGAE
jgi:hypothetical protein